MGAFYLGAVNVQQKKELSTWQGKITRKGGRTYPEKKKKKIKKKRNTHHKERPKEKGSLRGKQKKKITNLAQVKKKIQNTSNNPKFLTNPKNRRTTSQLKRLTS